MSSEKRQNGYDRLAAELHKEARKKPSAALSTGPDLSLGNLTVVTDSTRLRVIRPVRYGKHNIEALLTFFEQITTLPGGAGARLIPPDETYLPVVSSGVLLRARSARLRDTDLPPVKDTVRDLTEESDATLEAETGNIVFLPRKARMEMRVPIGGEVFTEAADIVTSLSEIYDGIMNITHTSFRIGTVPPEVYRAHQEAYDEVVAQSNIGAIALGPIEIHDH